PINFNKFIFYQKRRRKEKHSSNITSLHIPKISEPLVSHYKGKRLFIFPKNNSSRGKRLLCILVQVRTSSPGTQICLLQFPQDKILEHLEDQEHAATLGVPLKLLAHPNDVIGKMYGVEHSSRVRGIGGNVCPSTVFGMPRHSISHANVGSFSNMSHQRVEDLEKHVESLEEN
ncbi:hypothetical protein AABB24_005206, partial [Solanum stoloniferum]